jgi:hypothetical protein
MEKLFTESDMSLITSVDVESKPLIELAQFVLNRNTENIRDELHSYLAEVALLDLPNGATPAEIKSAIEKAFGFSDFPSLIVHSALTTLGKRLRTSGYPLRYFISEERRKELAGKLQDQKMLKDYFVARFLAKIETDYGEISQSASDEIVKCTFAFLTTMFGNLSISLSRLISESPDQVKDVAELLGVNEMLEKCFESIENKTLMKDAIQTIKTVLIDYDEKTSLFLYSLAQSYVLLKILNIDPQCQALQKELILSDMCVYLDTNIVINLLCEEALPMIHESCVRLVNIMHSLGIRCAISSRTTKEVERHLESSDKEYQNIGGVPDHRREKLLKYAGDEILREYWSKMRTYPGLKWTVFIGRLRNFSAILKRRYSIEIDNKTYDHIYSDPRFDELAKLIQEADPDKSPELVEHDCFTMTLIDHLRQETKGGEILPKRWFLTRDKSLTVVEKLRIMLEKKRPTSAYIDVWLQMISPLLSPKIATEQASEIFSRCLSSDLVPSFPRISPVLLTKLIGPCLDHTDLDMKEIQELIGDSYLREHFQEMGEKKVEVYLTQKLINIREKRHQKEKEQLQQEKKALSLELSKLREDKRELTKEVTTTKAQAGVEKHFGRYLAGGVIFLAIWILTYTLILLPTVQDSFIACVLAILISLIFGFLLGFKRYEWILQKFLDLVGTFKKS